MHIWKPSYSTLWEVCYSNLHASHVEAWNTTAPGCGKIVGRYVMSSSTVAEITTLHCHRKHTESEQIKKKRSEVSASCWGWCAREGVEKIHAFIWITATQLLKHQRGQGCPSLWKLKLSDVILHREWLSTSKGNRSEFIIRKPGWNICSQIVAVTNDFWPANVTLL